MSGEAENGFWDTVEAYAVLAQPVDHRQLPLLRLFFMSGHAFASTDPDSETWRRAVRDAAARYRTQ
jgi:hypothetical protein